jgi:hypothetical protein
MTRKQQSRHATYSGDGEQHASVSRLDEQGVHASEKDRRQGRGDRAHCVKEQSAIRERHGVQRLNESYNARISSDARTSEACAGGTQARKVEFRDERNPAEVERTAKAVDGRTGSASMRST